MNWLDARLGERRPLARWRDGTQYESKGGEAMPSAVVRVRVAFVDVDSSNRIHFTAFGRYMELAEHQLMRDLGFPYATTLRDSGFPRVHLCMDFSGAVLFDDQLDVEARVTRVGTSSWTVAFTATYADAPDRRPDATPGTIVARGEMTIVAMDLLTERAQPIPAELRSALEAG